MLTTKIAQASGYAHVAAMQDAMHSRDPHLRFPAELWASAQLNAGSWKGNICIGSHCLPPLKHYGEQQTFCEAVNSFTIIAMARTACM